MKKLIVALAAGNLAIGVIVFQLWLDLRAVRVQTSLLGDRIADAQSTRAVVPLKPAVSAPDIAAKATTRTAIGDSEAALVGDREVHIREVREAIARSDKLQKARRREMLPEVYPELGMELGLTQGQLDGFFDLLAGQQASSIADMRAKESMAFDAAWIQANEAEQAAMLGGKYGTWQEYQRTLPVRRQVAELQTALGPDAMSEAQSRALIATIAAEQARNQESRRSGPRLQNVEDMRHAAEEDNVRLVNAAAANLNPRQLEAYRSFLHRKQSSTATIMDLMISAGGSRTNR